MNIFNFSMNSLFEGYHTKMDETEEVLPTKTFYGKRK